MFGILTHFQYFLGVREFACVAMFSNNLWGLPGTGVFNVEIT